MKAKGLMTAAAIVLLLAASGAYACTIALRYSIDGINWTTWEDSSAPYAITVGPVATGIFSLLATGQGSPGLPSGSIDLATAVRTDAGGSGKLFVELSQDDLTVGPNLGMQAAAVFTGDGLSVIFSSFADASNALFGKTTPIASIGPVSESDGLSGVGTVAGGVFSLTQRMEITCTDCAPGSAVLGNSLLTQASGPTAGGLLAEPVPEPNSMIFLGIGLASLAAWIRRRSRKGPV